MVCKKLLRFYAGLSAWAVVAPVYFGHLFYLLEGRGCAGGLVATLGEPLSLVHCNRPESQANTLFVAVPGWI